MSKYNLADVVISLPLCPACPPLQAGTVACLVALQRAETKAAQVGSWTPNHPFRNASSCHFMRVHVYCNMWFIV